MYASALGLQSKDVGCPDLLAFLQSSGFQEKIMRTHGDGSDRYQGRRCWNPKLMSQSYE